MAEAGEEIDILLAGAGKIQYGKAYLAMQVEEELFEAAARARTGGVFTCGLQKRKVRRQVGLSPRRHRGFAASVEDGTKFFLKLHGLWFLRI